MVLIYRDLPAGNLPVVELVEPLLQGREDFPMLDQGTRRVLVIDDDSSIGEEICDTLALRNFEGLYCENIGQARRRLVGEDNVGVVIVDYHMPEMNGIEVIETLKKEIPRHLV